MLPCPATAPELVQSTLHGASAIGRSLVGTSFAGPKVAHIAAHLQHLPPRTDFALSRADRQLGPLAGMGRGGSTGAADVNFTPLWVLAFLISHAPAKKSRRVTLITAEMREIRNQQALIFSVPVPPAYRDSANPCRVRIDVTLCYTAMTRPTRSTKNGYLETWLSWKASHLEEPLDSFTRRATVTPERAGNYPD